jgi:hypothetical protein
MTAYLFLIHARGVGLPLGIAAICPELEVCTLRWRSCDGVTLPTLATSREWAAVERWLDRVPDGAVVPRTSALARKILGAVLGALLLDITRFASLDICVPPTASEWGHLLSEQLERASARAPDNASRALQ